MAAVIEQQASGQTAKVGDWVRTLSTREPVHGKTLVVEGRVMKTNDEEGALHELWVQYLTPIVMDGEVYRGGWCQGRDLQVINWADPRFR
jgi:hypothetical protein